MTSSRSSPPAVSPPSSDLSEWFAANGRDLPWRRTRDPWSILVAEVMLQQTQVDRVVVRWTRFLERFPTVAAAASVPVADVIDEWSGLGYNRRAVNLHRSAVEVVARFGGSIPRELADLLSLPGIGPYTARAIAVFAFERSEAVVDTNVARILARVGQEALKPAQAQRLADAWAAGHDPWSWNQALLDVGAIVCRAGDPVCDRCPLADACRWRASGRPLPDPAIGSAGVSGRQPRFAGSDREGRGRLVRALRDGPVKDADLAGVMGWSDDRRRADRVVAKLIEDGLVELADGSYRLPQA